MYRANIYDPLPVKIFEGRGCWVSTDRGQCLDCLAGYSAISLGHCHPIVVEAAKTQLGRLCLTSRAFDTEVMERWEALICKTFDAKMVLPMNSGAEGVETAIKIARKWGVKRKGVKDGDQQIVVCDGNFHGRTTTIISFSPNSNFREGFGPLTPGFLTCPFADVDTLRTLFVHYPGIVAFLVEPVQGEGGMNVPYSGYLADVRKLCDEFNVLLILDEVQTGLGRTGYLLAEEHDGIKADLTILGKALGGGIVPISCVLDRRGGIMDVLGPGDHGSTFGGNPLACAISLATMGVLKSSSMVANSKAMGGYILSELRNMGLAARGRGLMVGIPTVGAPASRQYCLALLKQRVLTKDSHGVVRITPPLIIEIKEVEYLLNAIREVFVKGVGLHDN